MIFSKNLEFKCFQKKRNSNLIKKNLSLLINQKNNEVINSLKLNYKYSYSKKFLNNLKKKYKKIRLIGMGGSILGTKAIFNFLDFKSKKKLYFFDNLNPKINNYKDQKFLNLIISKSGNTLETIANSNILIKKNDRNIFITENKQSYLKLLAEKLKSDVVSHNNFIGGRYSVLSEVGMLPSSLMGLKENKFKVFNKLVNNKNFINQLVSNVANILFLTKEKKYNSVIMNYDIKSNDFLNWYQQLVAESLGKKKFGIFPIISSMPKDNHSLMQLYLDGPKNNFYTFFYANEKRSNKINNKSILETYKVLKNKNLNEIIFAQKIATEKIFLSKKIPFRSFKILKRNEETLGELFTFFIFETILLGRAMKINPFDQPAVELIKEQTKKILISKKYS